MMKRMVAMAVVVLAACAAGKAVLNVKPDSLPYSGAMVEVSWSGIAHPSADDFLALYTPASNPDDAYYGWYMATNATTWASGSGTFLIGPVPNMRQPFQLRFFSAPSASSAALAVVASSPLVAPANADKPTGIHLALTGKPGQMAVTWTTASATGASVRFGAARSSLDRSAVPTTATYTVEDMCNAPANSSLYFIAPGFIHTAVLTDLEPGATVYYSVGSASGAWSLIRSFTVAPLVGPDVPVRAAIFGDLGVTVPFSIFPEQQAPASKTLKWVADYAPDVVLHVGDISYARGYGFLWEYFMQAIEPIASAIPWMVGVGNHEWDFVKDWGTAGRVPWLPSWANYGTDSGGECGVPYMTRFSMPNAHVSSNLYYSFARGNVHFVVISSETDFLPGSPQYEWLVSDLAAVNRSVTPWLVLSLHRPLYSSTAQMMGSPMVEKFVEVLEPLAIKYAVDLVLCGHVHVYERTRPLMGSGKDGPVIGPPGYPVYVILGMAGHTYQTPWSSYSPNHFFIPDYSVYRSMAWGYTTLVTNPDNGDGGTLTLTYHGDQENGIHDQVILHGATQAAHRARLSAA